MEKETLDQYFAFQWHITETCDQRCQHCYIFSENKHISPQEMPFEKIEDALDNCLEMCRKCRRIPYFYLTGGDPILHKAFWKILELLNENGISFSILGNPFYLNKEVCDLLKHYGCERYQLSIDGLQETHDAIRMPGSFGVTIKKIRCLRDSGICSVIMTTVSAANMQDIPGIIDMVVESRVDVFAFARYCPTSLEKKGHIIPLKYKELLGVCWERFEKYKEKGTTFHLKDHLWTLFLHEKGLFTIPQGLDDTTIYDGCNCGNSHLTILPNGDIYACRRLESKVGNIFSDRLYDVFTGSEMDSYRDLDKFEKCSKCELLQYCRGCPAVAYGHTRNFYAADPQCWKEV
jgi:radical SAM/SPASM domain protein of ACGX system